MEEIRLKGLKRKVRGYRIRGHGKCQDVGSEGAYNNDKYHDEKIHIVGVLASFMTHYHESCMQQ